MYKKFGLAIVLVISCLGIAGFTSVQAQGGTTSTNNCDTSAITLNVQRTFGYSSGNEIKGNFYLSVNAQKDCLAKVEFLLDGQPISTVSQAPFGFGFVTTDYPYGNHTLAARVTTTAGATFTTPERTFVFATSEQESQTVKRIVVPLVALVIVAILLSTVLPMILLRKRSPNNIEPGTARQYGISGGTICPRCGRPFPLHMFAPHFAFYKFDRCDNCGKWSMVKPMSMDVLRAAEKAEIKETEVQLPNQEKRDEDELKKMIDDTRFSK